MILFTDLDIQQIANVFSSQSDLLLRPGVAEIEMRFRTDVKAFFRLKELLDNTVKEVVVQDSVDTNFQSYRRISYINEEGVEVTRYIRKLRLYRRENKEYDTVVSLSFEEDLGDTPPPDIPFDAEGNVRRKLRNSYIIMNSSVKVDLTRVSSFNQREDHHDTFEVELELLKYNPRIDNTASFALFEKAARYILSKLQDSSILLKKSVKTQVLNDTVNWISETKRKNMFAPEKPLKLTQNLLVQSRDLKMADLVWGGILGNPETQYSTTIKADGERRLLVFHSTGVYFVAPLDRVNKISNAVIHDFLGSVFDGEYIPKNRRKIQDTPFYHAAHAWIAFDCLCLVGDRSIQNENHFARLKVCKNMVENVQLLNVYLMTKSFYSFSTPDEFYAKNAYLISLMEEVPFYHDGLMVTPVHSSYITQGSRTDIHNRFLTNVPDICKVKPAEMRTIDMAVSQRPLLNRKEDDLPFVLTVFQNGKLVPFLGDRKHPFKTTLNSVDISTPLLNLQNLPRNNAILEFRWDMDNKRFVPIRSRENDKEVPNNAAIAESIWKAIHNPVNLKTMIGMDFGQLRMHHNNLKRRVFEMIGKQDVLLDIGSGNGGDLSKWRGNYTKILAVEPDEAHRQEFMRRLATSQMKNVTLYAGTGQTALSILPADMHGKVNVLSLMLSLSFFFDTPESLHSLAVLANTMLAPGGQIGFLTINGDLLKGVLFPEMQGIGHVSDTSFVEWTIPGLQFHGEILIDNTWMKVEDAVKGGIYRDDVPKRVFVHLPDTIVSNQVESVVDMTAFLQALNSVGERRWAFRVHERADAGNDGWFLPKDCRIINRFYSYGIIEEVLAGGQKSERTPRETVRLMTPKKPSKMATTNLSTPSKHRRSR